jgi:hypothetical protein
LPCKKFTTSTRWRKSPRQRKRIFLVHSGRTDAAKSDAAFGLEDLVKLLASRRKINKSQNMLRLISILAALSMTYLPSVMACEGCKEPSSVAGDSGVGGISASFSWSVVFMLGMLTFLLTGMVLMMIRSCKQLAEQQQRLAVDRRDTGAVTSRFASSRQGTRDGSPAAVRLWPQLS